MDDKLRSIDLQPGTIMEHAATGDRPTLERRKVQGEKRASGDGWPFHPGWWCVEGGGLADFVIDAEDSEWSVYATPTAEGSTE